MQHLQFNTKGEIVRNKIMVFNCKFSYRMVNIVIIVIIDKVQGVLVEIDVISINTPCTCHLKEAL